MTDTAAYDAYTAPKVKTKSKTAPAAKPLPLNSEKEQHEERQFLTGMKEIADYKSEMSVKMNLINQVYKHLKKFNFTKADVKWGFELEEKDAPEVMATMQRRLRIAKMLGHGVARQMDLLETDRTPLVDRAYEMGLNVGKLRKEMSCPFDLASEAGQSWMKGVTDGTEFINKELAAAVEDTDPGFGDGQQEAAE